MEVQAPEFQQNQKLDLKSPRNNYFNSINAAKTKEFSFMTKNNHKIARMLFQKISNQENSGNNNTPLFQTTFAKKSVYPGDFPFLSSSCSPRQNSTHPKHLSKTITQSSKQKLKRFFRNIDSSSNAAEFVKYFESTPDLSCLISKPERTELINVFKDFLEPLSIDKESLKNLLNVIIEELETVDKNSKKDADSKGESIRAILFICLIIIYKNSFTCRETSQILRDGFNAVFSGLKFQIEGLQSIIKRQQNVIDDQQDKLQKQIFEYEFELQSKRDYIADLELRMKSSEELVSGLKRKSKKQKKAVLKKSEESLSSDDSDQDEVDERIKKSIINTSGKYKKDVYIEKNEIQVNDGDKMNEEAKEVLYAKSKCYLKSLKSTKSKLLNEGSLEKLDLKKETNFKNSCERLSSFRKIEGSPEGRVARANKTLKLTLYNETYMNNLTGSKGLIKSQSNMLQEKQLKKFTFAANYDLDTQAQPNFSSVLKKIGTMNKFALNANKMENFSQRTKTVNIADNNLNLEGEFTNNFRRATRDVNSVLGLQDSQIEGESLMKNMFFYDLLNPKKNFDKGVNTCIIYCDIGVQTDLKIPNNFFNQYLKNIKSFEKLLTELNFISNLEIPILIQGTFDSVIKLLHSPKVHVVKPNLIPTRLDPNEKQISIESNGIHKQNILRDNTNNEFMIRQQSAFYVEPSMEYHASVQETVFSRLKSDNIKNVEEFYLKQIETSLSNTLFHYIKNHVGGNFHEIFVKALVLLDVKRQRSTRKNKKLKRSLTILKEILTKPKNPLFKSDFVSQSDFLYSKRRSKSLCNSVNNDIITQSKPRRSYSQGPISKIENFKNESQIFNLRSSTKSGIRIISAHLSVELNENYNEIKNQVNEVLKKSWMAKQRSFTHAFSRKNLVIHDFEWKEHHRNIVGLTRYDSSKPNFFSLTLMQNSKINLITFFKMKYFHKLVEQNPNSLIHNYFEKKIINGGLGSDELSNDKDLNKKPNEPIDFKLLNDSCNSYENFVGYDLLMSTKGTELLRDFNYKVKFLTNIDFNISASVLTKTIFTLYKTYHAVCKLRTKYDAFRKVSFVELIYFYFCSVFASLKISEENFMLFLILCQKNIHIYSVNIFNRFVGISQPAFSLEELDEYVSLMFGIRFEKIVSTDIDQISIIEKIISQHGAMLMEKESNDILLGILFKRLKGKPQLYEQLKEKTTSNSVKISEITYFNFDYTMITYITLKRVSVWQEIKLIPLIYKAFDVLGTEKMNYFYLKKVLQKIFKNSSEFWDKFESHFTNIVNESEKAILLTSSHIADEEEANIKVSLLKFNKFMGAFEDCFDNKSIMNFIKFVDISLVVRSFEEKIGKILTKLLMIRCAVLNQLKINAKAASKKVSKSEEGFFSFFYGPLVYYIEHLMQLQSIDIVSFLIFYKSLKIEMRHLLSNNKF